MLLCPGCYLFLCIGCRRTLYGKCLFDLGMCAEFLQIFPAVRLAASLVCHYREHMLTPEMQEEFRKDKAAYSRFRKVILEERGEPVSFSYVTSLESAVLKPYIWKVRFLHKNNKDQKFYREALFRVVIGHIEDLKTTDKPEFQEMEKKSSEEDNGLFIFSFNFL